MRASTQIIGCSISLIVISPQMTFITLLCVPAVIALGSAVGSVLRQTSRRAQAQVNMKVFLFVTFVIFSF